jgi:LacI family transcriptional regulator
MLFVRDRLRTIEPLPVPAGPAATLVGVVWDPGYRRPEAHPFLADTLDAVRRALAARGHDTVLLGGADPVGRALDLGLAGVVLLGVNSRDPAVEALAASPVPCVGIDLDIRGPRSTWVTADNLGGAATAVRHLYETGRRRIATITGPMHLRPSVERLLGYRRELARLGVECPPEYTVEADLTVAGGEAAMRRLLALPEPPDGVFVAGDPMAAGALHAGARVPAEVGIVAFDDSALAGQTRPRLSTVRQDPAAFGATAVELLFTLGTWPASSPGPPPVVLPTALVVRESCGKMAP